MISAPVSSTFIEGRHLGHTEEDAKAYVRETGDVRTFSIGDFFLAALNNFTASGWFAATTWA
jgi:hypothetical protein